MRHSTGLASLRGILLQPPGILPEWLLEANEEMISILEEPALRMFASPPCAAPAVATETPFSELLCSQEEPDPGQRRQAPLWRKCAQVPHLPRMSSGRLSAHSLPQLPPLLFSTHHFPDSQAVGTTAQTAWASAGAGL